MFFYLVGSILFAMAAGAAMAHHVWGAAIAYVILCAIFLFSGCATYNKED